MAATVLEPILRRYSRRAMATTFEILFPWNASNSEVASQVAFDLIDKLENQLSVFRPTSEISRLNRLAVQAPVPVEQKLFELLELTARINKQTGGTLDITAGPLIKAWGFFRRQGRVPNDTELQEALACVGMKNVELDTQRRAVRFAKPGVEINLGSIGKGYALDRAACELTANFGIQAALLNGGTSSVYALGQPAPGVGWNVGVQHPWQPRRLGTLNLINRGMATSGATHQHFAYNGKTLGHLLDPRSGRPAEDTALTVALARTATEADALSTAFFVMGIEGTRRYCEQHAEAAAIVLSDEPGAEPVAINCSADEWTPAPPNDFYPPSDVNDE